jgi:hypothetical protein
MKLPPYVDASAGPNYPIALTLTAAPGIGATTATLSANWTKKTGIYPVQFFSSPASNKNEQRYVTFTQNSTTITWNNGYNPNAIDGTLGAALVTNCTARISVAYLCGVTNYDLDINGALATLSFGGSGTYGWGLLMNQVLVNVRFIGIALVPKKIPITDTAGTFNFGCVNFGQQDTSVYFDRCVFGGDATKFTTTGWGQAGAVPVETSTTYGFCQAGLDNVHCNNLFVGQCYFRGLARPPNGVAQDSFSIGVLGGGPACVQYNHLESVSECYIAGGGFVSRPPNVPNNLTYQYNFSTKPQWWASAFQTLTLTSPVSTYATANITGNGTVGPYTSAQMAGAALAESFRYGVWLNNVLQAPATYTINVTANTITFAAPVASGVAILVKFAAKIIFGDYVKNLFELKVMLGCQAYGNVHWNCWYSNVAGYQGSAFAPGCRDQVSSNPAFTSTGAVNRTVVQTEPWSGQIYDLDIHDNIAIGVGQADNPFGGGVYYCPASSAGRYRYLNNMVHMQNPWISTSIPLYRGRVRGLLVQGNIPDFIIDHNTFIIDQTNTITPGTQLGLEMPPGSFDRSKITNNIIPGTHAVYGNSTTPSVLTSTAFTNPSGGGWNNNLTIFDATGPFPAGSFTYQAIPYASVGFTNWVNEQTPPAQPSDWNVSSISGHIGTDGAPVGATFGAAATLAADAFPRTFMIYYGTITSGTSNAGVPFATVAAQYNVVSLAYNLGTAAQSVISGWKSAATTNGITLRVLNYIPGGSAYYQLAGTNAWLANGLANSNMWLYNAQAGTGITNIQTYAGFATQEAFPLFTAANTKTVVSFTYNGKTGVNVGMNLWQVCAQYYWDVFSQGLSASKYGYIAQAATPALDGLFFDNAMSNRAPHFFSTTSSTWNGQGTTPIANSSEPVAIVQQGIAKYVPAFRAVNPSMLLVANSDFANQLPALDPSSNGLWNGVFNEEVIANLESFQSSPGSFMASLIAAEPIIASGGTLIFHQTSSPGGVNNLSGNQSGWTATQWRSVRFGFACAMMRNWHYALNCGQGAYTAVGLLDEQAQLVAGMLNYGWLSAGTQRLDPPQSGPGGQGGFLTGTGDIAHVWCRRFPNGWVLWKPRTTPTPLTATVNVPTTLRRIAQTSRGNYGDATVNTGLVVSGGTVTLQDADGLFLIGTG